MNIVAKPHTRRILLPLLRQPPPLTPPARTCQRQRQRPISSTAAARSQNDDDKNNTNNDWDAELRRRRERLHEAWPLFGKNSGRHRHHQQSSPSSDSSSSSSSPPSSSKTPVPLTAEEYRQHLIEQQQQRERFEEQETIQMEQRLRHQQQMKLREQFMKQAAEYKRYQDEQKQQWEYYQSKGYHQGGHDGDEGASRRRTSRLFWLCSAACGVAFYVYNTETVPVSGRRRFNWIPEEWVQSRSEKEWPEMFAELTKDVDVLPPEDAKVRLVNKVLNRLLLAANTTTAVSPPSDWTIHVLDAPSTVNASVLPHRVILIFSGLFRLATHEAELAAVLSHELGHHITGHPREQASNTNTLRFFYVGLLALTAVQRRWLRFAAVLALGGAALELWADRPLRRQHETEADLVGISLMADACYDPRAAASWWRKVMAVSRAEEPEFVSTHPPHEKRLQEVLRAMPAALARFEKADCQRMRAFAQEALGRKKIGVHVGGEVVP